MPETVPLDFTEDDAIWVASKIYGATGVLGAEAVELRNWIICFGCAVEELRVIAAKLSDSMANPPPPPQAAYQALMAGCLEALDKRPGCASWE